MQHQKGFTLIELIIVIVILGILAVTAAPKFIDIQKDAKASTVKAVQGALNSAISIAYGKALIAGQNGDTGSVSINNVTVPLVNGYPDATFNLTGLLDIDGEMSAVFKNATDTSVTSTSAIDFYGVTPDDYESDTLETQGCTITYLQAANANTAPVITVYTAGCN